MICIILFNIYNILHYAIWVLIIITNHIKSHLRVQHPYHHQFTSIQQWVVHYRDEKILEMFASFEYERCRLVCVNNEEKLGLSVV